MMAGFGSEDFEGYPTGDWRLKLILDEHIAMVQRALFTIDRNMEEIGVQPQADLEAVHLLDGIGWQLKAHQFDLSKTYELAVAQDGVMTVSNGKLTAAGHMEEIPLFKEKPGITYAGSPASGMLAMTKRVAAGDAWSQSVAGDTTLLGKPDTTSENVVMDRIIVSTSDHVPGDHLHIRIFIPESEMASSDGLITLYFNAGAGKWDTWEGQGKYSLKLYGDGRASLFERGQSPADLTDSWLQVKDFTWAPSAQVFNAYHGITIAMDGKNVDEEYFGTAMVFAFTGMPLGREGTPMDRWIDGVAGGLSSARTISYKPRQSEQIPIQTDKIRVDTRADLRPTISLFGSTYPDDGYIYDSIISYPCDLKGSVPLTIAWFGDKPSGTSVTIVLKDPLTGTVLSGGTVTDEDFGGVVTYPVPVGLRHFRILATLFSSGDNRKTPTIRTLRFFRDALIETPTVTPVEIQEREESGLLKEFLTEISVEHPGRNISGQAASFTLVDLGGDLTRLSNRGSIPARVIIEREGEDDVTLFRGFIEEPTEKRIAPSQGASWPVAGGRTFDCNLAGMWRPVQEALSQTSFNWVYPASGLPYKITDLVRTLMLSVTEASRLDIPDLATRLWSSEVRDLMPQGVELLPYLADLIQGYLGGRFIWDDSAGTDGLYRLLLAPQPPYTPVAAFTMQGPPSGRLASSPEAYDEIIHSPSGAVLRPKPILKGSWWSRTRKIEGNFIVVVGLADMADKSGMVQQYAMNVKSFPAHTGAPALDPDYPGLLGHMVEVRLVDRGLIGAAAVNWTVKRLYDAVATPRKDYGLMAHSQLIMDPTDTLQERARPLRDYDPVLLIDEEGNQIMCLVTSAKTSGVKSFLMKDHLTLMSVDPVVVGENFSGLIPPDRSIEKTIMRIAARMQGLDIVSNPTETSRGRDYRRSLQGSSAEILAPIQDLNPASPDYGKWI